MTSEVSGFFGLEFEVEIKNASMQGGEDAYIAYLKVDNKTSESKKIILHNAIYVTNDREQLDQDIWLSGYMIGETTLKPNSYKKAGHVFYQTKLTQISEGDYFYITIELPRDGKELTLCFRKDGEYWRLINNEQADIEIKLTPKQLEKVLLKRVERLEAFEERFGISIQNISLKIKDDYNWLTFYCEVHSINGTTINDSIYIECILYNQDGSIINKCCDYIVADEFFGFRVVELTLQGDNKSEQISKIRIFPRL